MLIMNENIRIYLHFAMIFAQQNLFLHNICFAIFRICYSFNQAFSLMFMVGIHLLRRDVEICATSQPPLSYSCKRVKPYPLNMPSVYFRLFRSQAFQPK